MKKSCYDYYYYYMAAYFVQKGRWWDGLAGGLPMNAWNDKNLMP